MNFLSLPSYKSMLLFNGGGMKKSAGKVALAVKSLRDIVDLYRYPDAAFNSQPTGKRKNLQEKSRRERDI